MPSPHLSPSDDLPLAFDNVSFGYHEEIVLDKINCQVEPGEWIGIIGPNGGGKTTFLNLAMGFLSPTRGKCTLFGKAPKQSRQLLGYVPQSFSFDPNFPINVLDVVLGGCKPKWGGYRKQDREEALAALQEVGLMEWSNVPFANLSGGQAQRVLIARAIVHAPQILLLDEPTANIDVEGEAEVIEMLRALRGKMTLLMVTHNLSSIVREVDRIFCLQGALTEMSREEICQHYEVGVYHPPEGECS